jgi:ribonuclease BN (tRNA processing enzyme)
MDKYYTHLPRPKVVGLTPGDTFETDDLLIKTAPARHPVQALSYRIEEKGGAALAASGDTAYNPHTRELYRGCVALIHDCTMGLNQNLEPPEMRKNGHSNLYEAVQCAAEAGIPTLFPVHMAKDYAAYAAANIGDTRGVTITLPERGKVYTL